VAYGTDNLEAAEEIVWVFPETDHIACVAMTREVVRD
jgi:hypothetical protein